MKAALLPLLILLGLTVGLMSPPDTARIKELQDKLEVLEVDKIFLMRPATIDEEIRQVKSELNAL